MYNVLYMFAVAIQILGKLEDVIHITHIGLRNCISMKTVATVRLMYLIQITFQETTDVDQNALQRHLNYNKYH